MFYALPRTAGQKKWSLGEPVQAANHVAQIVNDLLESHCFGTASGHPVLPKISMASALEFFQKKFRIHVPGMSFWLCLIDLGLDYVNLNFKQKKNRDIVAGS